MTKNKYKFIIALVFALLFVGTATYVFADDDEEGNDDWREYITTQVVEPIQPTNTVVTPYPTPTVILAGIPQTKIINIPVTTTQDNFVDSDSDGIIDILDAHQGEDDFAYAVKDSNNNGIADDLEYLLAP